ncbi:Aste57867_24237 [Aphanomyces stellatus]|uniref:Aste57867_24237 protein n=1 Tax=Aphanomyces stellatus TaxID=120398 RepID=A0A485LQM2_9STRA|nr:hypothetical protein As57867_024162 [Aphanomyces stellatus]VFU00878.1 Aste57867_24237 [Aphanomyces stellatus]
MMASIVGVLTSPPLTQLISSFQDGVSEAVYAIQHCISSWHCIDGVHGRLNQRPKSVKLPWLSRGGGVNIHMDELESIMAVRHAVMAPLLTSKQVSLLHDLLATDTYARALIAEYAAFYGRLDLFKMVLQHAQGRSWDYVHKYVEYSTRSRITMESVYTGHSKTYRSTTGSLHQLAAYHGHDCIVEALRGTNATSYSIENAWGGPDEYSDIHVAAERGNIAHLNFILNNIDRDGRTKTSVEADLLDAMASEGRLQIVDALCQHGVSATTRAMDEAAANGHVDVVKLLYENDSKCTTAAMDGAAANGHDDIVRFLHVNRTEGCTVEAMNAYAARGNLAMVQWLDENRSEKCSPRALSAAASSGHVAVVEYLVQHKLVTAAAPALLVAASHGQLSIVQLLRGNFPHLCVAKPLQVAAKASHDEVVRYLDVNRCECCHRIPLSDLVIAKKPSKKRMRR